MNNNVFLNRCIQLAIMAKDSVLTNPMVGALLLHDNEIIGEGYHEKYGEAHAEVNCLKSVKKEKNHLIADSTLYVSLEPCNHSGKTPPCVDLILENNINKVVIGCTDSFEKVNGKGIQRLKENGVEVIFSNEVNKFIDFNKRFFTFHSKQRPYIILKWAQTKNGYIAKENTQIKISNAVTDRLVHKWRSEEDAIWVGANTVQIDNPALTTRLYKGKNPVRITYDTSNDIITKNICNQEANTIIFNSSKNEIINNIEYILCEKDLLKQLQHIYHRNIKSILIEGGSQLLQQFIDAKLWDEARVIVSNTVMINNGIISPSLKNNSCKEKISLLDDEVYFYQNQHI
jgi:diaminohydroxyphosphoribosylaminopyrimidine deaminase/5-amino-6-(5-phosphoribosylamino)uracil reductase